MPIEIACGNCENNFGVQPQWAGLIVQCPFCQVAVQVPEEVRELGDAASPSPVEEDAGQPPPPTSAEASHDEIRIDSEAGVDLRETAEAPAGFLGLEAANPTDEGRRTGPGHPSFEGVPDPIPAAGRQREPDFRHLQATPPAPSAAEKPLRHDDPSPAAEPQPDRAAATGSRAQSKVDRRASREKRQRWKLTGPPDPPEASAARGAEGPPEHSGKTPVPEDSRETGVAAPWPRRPLAPPPACAWLTSQPAGDVEQDDVALGQGKSNAKQEADGPLSATEDVGETSQVEEATDQAATGIPIVIQTGVTTIEYQGEKVVLREHPHARRWYALAAFILSIIVLTALTIILYFVSR